MVSGSWLVLASALAGIGTLALIARLWRYREKPGATWFLASLACQALWSLGYALALVTYDPALRLALEVVIWGLMATMSVTFLSFALAYTGRAVRVRSALGRVLLAAPPVVTLAVATNPWHRLVWTDFAVVPVAGLATASYALRPWALPLAIVGALLPTVGTLLLFDTVLSYGRLYRSEAVAVGVSTVPPTAALLVWLVGAGPVPTVNFATALFLPHVAFDAYAFVRSDMFEFHPATRRVGERAAIEDLGTPVVVIDEQRRVVTLNAAASDLLGADKRAALTTPLDEYFPADEIDPAAGEQRVTVDVDGTPRTYLATPKPLSDGAGTHVGYTVVFQDLTDDLRREQRLDVLNRVLRHNLRNDMTVVRGFAAAANEAVDDEEVSGMLDTVVRNADALVALGEKARTVERVLANDPAVAPVALDDLLADVVAAVDADFPDVAVALSCPAVTVETDDRTLSAVCRALIENAAEHGSASPRSPSAREDAAEHGTPDGEAAVRITVEETEDGVTIAVADDGPGIPEQELAVIDSGRETDLEHSTGLGLWLASWGTRRLGGTLSFDVSDGGTTATVALPAEREDD